MANAGMDHLISLVIFAAAMLIFLSMFSSSMQTGLAYQRHSALSTKTSDLIDTLLLNPGLPMDWGQLDNTPMGLGLQDPEFTQYRLSSYSPTRLTCTTNPSAYYYTSGTSYSNNTAGYGGYLLTQSQKTLNYSAASQLLGVNGTYGFQLSISPTVAFSVEKTSVGSPLTFEINAAGTGYPIANAPLYYNLLIVDQGAGSYPYYWTKSGKTLTDAAGTAQLTFNGIDGNNKAYALVVYSYLHGLKGVGYYVNVPSSFGVGVMPLVDSFQNRTVTLVHGASMEQYPAQTQQLTYNASFVIRTEEFALRPVLLDQANATGQLVHGSPTQPDYASINMPNNEGILIVTYKGLADQYGIVLMPWGFGALGFTATFGGNPAGHEWVTSDMRAVTIDGIAYQAKLGLWMLNGGA
jgi:hypothetical protein